MASSGGGEDHPHLQLGPLSFESKVLRSRQWDAEGRELNVLIGRDACVSLWKSLFRTDRTLQVTIRERFGVRVKKNSGAAADV